MGKHMSGQVWCGWFGGRPDASPGRLVNVNVRTLSPAAIEVALEFPELRNKEVAILLDRADARMVAKRITQCLDATR